MIGKEKILEETIRSFENGKDIEWTYDMIRDAFGFKRMDAQGILLGKLIFPSRSEKELQMLPDHEIKKNIEQWCGENGFFPFFIPERNSYVFYKPKPIKS